MEGGPFRYCDRIGIQTVVQRLETLAQENGRRYAPAFHAETRQKPVQPSIQREKTKPKLNGMGS